MTLSEFQIAVARNGRSRIVVGVGDQEQPWLQDPNIEKRGQRASAHPA